MKQLSVDSGQLAVGDRQVVFEPEFDVKQLRIAIKDTPRNRSLVFNVYFYESGALAHSSSKYFSIPAKAFEYSQKVIARYKLLIAAAELAFILGDDRSDLAEQFDNVSKLDEDFVKVVRAADEGQEGEGAG